MHERAARRQPPFAGGTVTVTGTTGADEEFDIFLQGTATRIGSGDTETGATDLGHLVDSGTIPSTKAAGTHTVTVDPETTADLPCGSIVVTAPTPTPTATATASPTATPTDEPDDTSTPAPRTGTARLNVLGDDKFQRGERVKVTAARVTPNENYVLDFAQSPGTIVARATSNRLGSARFEFRIPTNARLGAATLTALPADGSGLRASATIEIVGGSSGAVSNRGNSLPKTGVNVAVYTTLAMLLLLGGLTMRRFEWLRRSRAVHQPPIIPTRLWG